MLELNKRNTSAPIRIEFPGGAHAGERYNAGFTFCTNPVCTCGNLKLTLFRDPQEEGEASIPEFRFEVDILEKGLVRSSEDASEYDHNMARAFVEQMTDKDWRMLVGLYAGYKQKITEETPDAELRTHFPAAEIEQSGVTVGFHEILPFGKDIALETDGRRFLIDDLYCVRTQCPCTDCFVAVIEERRSEQDAEVRHPPMLKVDYRTRRWRVVNRRGEDIAVLGRLAEQLMSDDNCARLKGRHERLKSLYVMHKRAHRQPKRSITDKPGRNDPCPCGSGKKYKKCCMPSR